MHGDLHAGNTLIQDKKTNLIDFEYANTYIFIYDIFNYIYFESVIRGDSSYLKLYCNGEYDSLLDAMFKKFDMMYDCNKKAEYMLLFLAERLLKKRFSKRDSKTEVALFFTQFDYHMKM